MRFRRRAATVAREPGGLTESDAAPALSAAEALVGAGQVADAIALLTEENRARRDARIERRLVEIRSRAFLDGAWPESTPPWPESVEDLFPGQAIPEIAAADLSSARVRSAIRHHGSLIVRGLIGHDDVRRLVADVDRALAAYDARAEGRDRPDIDGWYEPFTRDDMSNREQKRFRGSVLTVESPATLFDLIEIFDAVGLTDVVRDYFGEPPMLLARKGTLRRIAHTGNTGGWHQDGAFMGAGIRSINIWLALTHCGDDAPGLDVVGRRLDEIVPTGDGAFTGWAASPEAAEQTAAGAIVRPIFDAGDALIFDHMNLHRTAIEPEMVHDRHAIETWLMAPSTYGAMTAAPEHGYTPRDQIPVVF